MKQDNIIKVDYDNKWNGQQKDDEVTGSLLYSQIGQVESKVNQTQVHTRNTLSLLMLPSKCNARRKTWSTRPTKTSHTVCSRKNLKEVHNFTRMLFWWILIISWVKLPSGIVVSVSEHSPKRQDLQRKFTVLSLRWAGKEKGISLTWSS